MSAQAVEIPASLLPDPDVVRFVKARAADEYPSRAASMRAIVWTLESNVERWRFAEKAGNTDATFHWGGVEAARTAVNYLAMAYRHHPDYPEQCRDWRFPDDDDVAEEEQ